MDILIQKPDCEFEKNLKFLYYHIKDDYLREKEEINKKISKLSSLLNVLVTALGIFILLFIYQKVIFYLQGFAPHPSSFCDTGEARLRREPKRLQFYKSKIMSY